MTENTENCRLCLTKLKPKNAFSLFQSAKNMRYSDMVQEIANVKIAEGDGLPNNVCQICRRQVKEFYEFRQQVQSSDKKLRKEHCPSKIYFTNIGEIEQEIQSLLKLENNNKKELNTPNDNKRENYNKKAVELNTHNDNSLLNDIVMNEAISSVVTKENYMLLDEFMDSIKADNDIYIHDFDDMNDNNDNNLDHEPVIDHDPVSGHEPSPQPENPPPGTRRIIKKFKLKEKKKKPRSDDERDVDYDPIKSKPKERKGVKSKLGRPRKNFFTEVIDENGEIRIEPFKPTYVYTKITPRYKDDIDVVVLHPKKPRTYECSSICPHCGASPKNLHRHLQKHKVKPQLNCDQCERTFKYKISLVIHKRTHMKDRPREHKCGLCPADFYDVPCLKKHMETHSTRKGIKCRICDKILANRASHRRHERTHNMANKNVKCTLCPMTFFSVANLNHHMRIHTGERPHKCENVKWTLCPMSQHMRIHTGERPHKSELCNQPYSYKHDFNRHCLMKHGVFLKRRNVRVMNEEVLEREKEITKGLFLRAYGIIGESDQYNPFEEEGARGVLALNQAISDIKKGKVPIPSDLEGLLKLS